MECPKDANPVDDRMLGDVHGVDASIGDRLDHKYTQKGCEKMSDWINKNIFKSRCVRALIFREDHRMVTRYLIPTVDDHITAGDRTFMIDHENFFFQKGIPTYVYNSVCPSPVNVNTVKADMTSQQFNVAVTSKVERNVFKADQKGMKAGTLSLLFGLLTLVAIGGVIYMMIDRFDAMQAEIDQLTQLLRLIGGLG